MFNDDDLQLTYQYIKYIIKYGGTLNDDDRRLHNQAIATLTHLLLIHKISPYNKNREAGGNMCPDL